MPTTQHPLLLFAPVCPDAAAEQPHILLGPDTVPQYSIRVRTTCSIPSLSPLQGCPPLKRESSLGGNWTSLKQPLAPNPPHRIDIHILSTGAPITWDLSPAILLEGSKWRISLHSQIRWNVATSLVSIEANCYLHRVYLPSASITLFCRKARVGLISTPCAPAPWALPKVSLREEPFDKASQIRETASPIPGYLLGLTLSGQS
jgi:hypothetical protein